MAHLRRPYTSSEVTTPGTGRVSTMSFQCLRTLRGSQHCARQDAANPSLKVELLMLAFRLPTPYKVTICVTFLMNNS